MTSLFTTLRGGLTYANVLATGAIFIALGGGAYAVTALPSANSVGPVSRRTRRSP